MIEAISAGESGAISATNIETFEADFLKWTPEQPVDKVLLDAPCSGLGVLRRHPEGKWLKTKMAIGRAKSRQIEMIEHAMEMIKPGGELIYSVCSFEPEETTEQLAWLTKKFEGQFEQVSPLPRLPDYYKKYVTRENVLLIFSGNLDDMDGFGAFLVKKNQ